MAVRRLAEEQPESFTFTAENLAWVKKKVAEYPEGRQASAVIPVLWRAQAQHGGWLPEPAIRLVADMLGMPYIRVFEIATFYTMFQLQPVGTVAHLGVCGTTPCMLRGAEAIVDVCRRRIAPRPFALSGDGRFSWEEVECAGACVNAPMVQIGPDTYEDLTPERFEVILDTLASGGTPQPGPQSGRKASEPLSGAKTVRVREPAVAGAPGEADDLLPPAGVSPTAPEASKELAGRPSGNGRAEIEAARAGAPLPEDTLETARPKPRKEPQPGHAAEAQGLARKETVDPLAARAMPPAAPDEAAAARADEVGSRPPAVRRADVAEPDDLQQISGIGPVIERTLHDLGIFTFAQIAAWTEAHKAWVSAYLTFKGRIDREQWVEQARAIVDETAKTH